MSGIKRPGSEFVQDIDAGTGPNAVGAGGNHLPERLQGAHATGGFDADRFSDSATHHLHVGDSGAACREASGGFDEIGVCF